jgi:hypothetical protein
LPSHKHIYTYSSEKINYKSTAYFADLEIIEYDKDYEWTIIGERDDKPVSVGPFNFKLKLKDGFDEFNFLIISNMDISENSIMTRKRLSKIKDLTYDGLFH